MTDDTTPSTPVPEARDLQTPAAASTSRPPQLRELSPRTMWLTAAVVVVLTAAAVVVLWWLATRGLNGGELVTARLDALKIGLSIGVGSGGVVALYLAWRRQHSTERTLAHQQEVHAATMAHQDRVARATEHDAAERRLSELYLKAVEQLGSAEAAVRHGGLYALERVAQDNPEQRQTVVNVICAYLRGHYTPPPETGSTRRPLGVRRPLLRSTTVARTPAPRVDTQARESQSQEREVRLTAQDILQRHLRPGEGPDHSQSFWSGVDINLAGATLINFSFSDCHVGGEANFRTTNFIGAALFDKATFSGAASFGEATFSGGVVFNKATFTGKAVFDGAVFSGHARFDGATFSGGASFDRATFSSEAVFDGATFPSFGGFKRAAFIGDVSFVRVVFSGQATFGEATFYSAARFIDTTFSCGAWFDGAIFTGDARFDQATFRHLGTFDRVTFTGVARFGEAAFTGDARFRGVTFTGDAEFRGVTFTDGASFEDTRFTGDLQVDWNTFTRDVKFGGATWNEFSLDSTTHDQSPRGESSPDSQGDSP